jgi:DNA-binding transcriptional MerR regulator
MSNCENVPTKTGAEAAWFDDSGRAQGPSAGGRVLSIGNVATMFGVSSAALRYYEFRGLIRRRGRVEGTRVYSWADCDRIAFIIKCRRAGLSLAKIAPLIRAVDDDESSLAYESGQECCMELVDQLERRRRVIDDALAELVHTHSLLSAKLSGDPGPADRS